MGVGIDESRTDHQTAGIDLMLRCTAVNAGGYLRNLPVGYRNIGWIGGVSRSIDNRAIFDDNVVTFSHIFSLNHLA
jgi:hypothetical protein